MQRNDAHLDFLDLLRGVAILGVFLFHCHGAVYGWRPDASHPTVDYILLSPLFIGGAGVSMFFAISGFCIHLSHQRSSRKDMATFFTRRFFRIYPPYLLALVIFSFLFPWDPSHFHRGFLRDQFGAHLLLIHNLFAQTIFEINGAFWTIAVEVQLYFIYPLLLGVVRAVAWSRALWITFLIEAGIRIYSGISTALYQTQPPWLIVGSPFGYWFSWTIGAAAAEAFLKGESLPLHRLPIWVFPVLTLGFGAIPVLAPFCFVFGALSTVGFINAFLKRPGAGSQTWLGRHLRFTGLVSYSVYLLHLPLVVVFAERLSNSHFHFPPVVVFLLTCALWIPMLAISWGFYRLLELPSIELGKRVVKAAAANRTEKREDCGRA